MQVPLIIHIFPTFGLGGQQRRFAELVAGLSYPFRHHVINLSDDNDARDLIPASAYVEISTLKLKKTSFTHPHNLKAFKSLFWRLKPNLVCTYNWGSIEAVMALNLTRKWRIPHCHFEDGFGFDETPQDQKTTRVMARRFLLGRSNTIVPSKTLYTLAKSKWKLKGHLVQHIPNGIDTHRFTVKDRVYNHTGPVKIGTVGAFRPEKNLVGLINLFDECDVVPPSALALVGDGPQMDILQSKARTSMRNTNITLPGATAEPEKAYADFDIFALTSDTEQMPISLIEAMMAGLPVVATDVGDIRSMVSDENQQFICEVGDEANLIRSFEKLVEDEKLREKLGRANRKKALAEFDRRHMIDAFEQLYLSKIQ